MINPIIYAEVSIGFNQVDELEAALPSTFFRRDPLPYKPRFLTGQSFLQYRRRGGDRRSPLPDFYIGAHAAIAGLSLLTSAYLHDFGRSDVYFGTPTSKSANRVYKAR